MQKLATLANNIQKQSRPISNTIVGVVVDVTRPLYREKQDNYIVMLKIIDETLNDTKIFGVMSKDCCVYLISKNKNQIDFIRGVGEIVVLDKFSFSLWNDIKLETKYLGTTEGMYNVTINSYTNKLVIKNKLSNNPELFDITDILVERVQYLMQWRSTTLPKIYDPKLGIHILNSHCVMIQPFNMILRYEGINFQQQNTNEQIYLILRDENKNKFTIRQVSDCLYQQGDLLLIRGIRTVGQTLTLQLTQTGNILRYTFQVDPKLMNYMAIHRDNENIIKQKNQNQFTTIHSQYNNVAYLSELMQLQDKYNHTTKKEDVEVRDSYIINVIVINYEGKLSLYHREFQIILHEDYLNQLSPEDKRQIIEANKIGYIYEGVIGLFDRSNENKNKLFYAHLFTCDAIGNFMAPQDFQRAQKGIGTMEQNIKRKQLLDSIHKKFKRLASESTFTRPVTLVLEPVRSEKLLFRVVSTKIL